MAILKVNKLTIVNSLTRGVIRGIQNEQKN